jgi:hypothetical protein
VPDRAYFNASPDRRGCDSQRDRRGAQGDAQHHAVFFQEREGEQHGHERRGAVQRIDRHLSLNNMPEIS